MLTGLLSPVNLPVVTGFRDDRVFLAGTIKVLQENWSEIHCAFGRRIIHNTSNGILDINDMKGISRSHLISPCASSGHRLCMIGADIWNAIPPTKWGKDITNSLTEIFYSYITGILNVIRLGADESIGVHVQLIELKQVSDPVHTTRIGWPVFTIPLRYDYSDHYTSLSTPEMHLAHQKIKDKIRREFKTGQAPPSTSMILGQQEEQDQAGLKAIEAHYQISYF